MRHRKNDPLSQTRATGPLGKRSVFLLVCRAVYASGGVGDEERELIKKLQRTFRIPPDQAKGLLGQAKRTTKHIEGEELSRTEVFARACRLAWTTGDLTPRERKILTALAAAMKLGKAEAEAILAETYEAQATGKSLLTMDLVAEDGARFEVGPAEAPPAPPGPPPRPAPGGGARPAPPVVAEPEPTLEPEPEPMAAEPTPPTEPAPARGLGTLLGGLVVGLLLALGAMGGLAWWAQQRVAELSKGDHILGQVRPAPGAPTNADEAFQEALGAFSKLPRKEGPWGFGAGSEVKPTPAAEVASLWLTESETLRRVMTTRFGPAIEPDEHDVVLQKEHSFQEHRRLHARLAEDFLCLLLLDRHDEAVALAEAMERHARVLARGVANQPTLLVRMSALGCAQDLDAALEAALSRGLIPAAEKPKLGAVLREAIEREPPVDVALRAEFERARRAVRAFDEELGPLRYLLQLQWGDGLATVDDLERRWKQGEPAPAQEVLERAHVAIRMILPNYQSVRSRGKAAQAIRRKLLGELVGTGP